jgi:hypothetical protein
MHMDMKVLYIELYVSFLLAVIVYVLMELFKVETEKAPAGGDERQPINFPRFSIWLVGIGMFLVIMGWLTSFGINEAVKYLTYKNLNEAVKELADAKDPKSEDYKNSIIRLNKSVEDLPKSTDSKSTDYENSITHLNEAVKTLSTSTDFSSKDYENGIHLLNEAVAAITKSTVYENGIILTAKWLFFPGTIAVAISLLIFGYKAAIHPRSPSWFNLAGIIAIAIGLLAFCASAAVGCVVRNINSETTPVPEVVLITGLLNPFFFVGVPLGFYWLYRSKRASAPRAK